MRFHVFLTAAFLLVGFAFANETQAGNSVGRHYPRHHPGHLHPGHARPCCTVKAQIFNQSATDVRFKIIPFAKHQIPYAIDLCGNYKSPLIPNMKKGQRAFVVFDLITGQALSTAIFPIHGNVDIVLVDGANHGEVEITVKVKP